MKAYLQNKWVVFCIILGLTIGGTVLRVAELPKTDLWYDEAFTGLLVRETWSDMLSIIKRDKVHPPTYYGLLKTWTATIKSTSPNAIRSFSIIFGVLAIPLIYFVVQQFTLIPELSRKSFGIAAATVMAISPFFIAYSIEARTYSLLLCFMLISLYFFLKTIQTPFKITWSMGLWLLSIVLIAFTHYLSMLVISGYIVAYLILWVQANKTLEKKGIWKIIGWSIFALWILGTFAWNSLKLNNLIAGNNLGWIPSSDLSVLPQTIASFLFGVNRQALGFPEVYQFTFGLQPRSLGFVIILATIAAFTVVLQKKKGTEYTHLLLIGAISVIPLVCDILASSLGLNIYVDRYVIGYGTFLLLFIGYIWWELSEENTYIGLVIYVILLFFIVAPAPSHPYTQALDVVPPITTENHLFIQSPIDYLVFRYYGSNGHIVVIPPETGHYNWGYVPESAELSLTQARQGDVYILQKGSLAPAGWVYTGETKQYTLYQKQYSD